MGLWWQAENGDKVSGSKKTGSISYWLGLLLGARSKASSCRFNDRLIHSRNFDLIMLMHIFVVGSSIELIVDQIEF